MAYMFSYSPPSPPVNLAQGPPPSNWCIHGPELGTTPSEAMCGVWLQEASSRCKSGDKALYHVVHHLSRRVWNAIRWEIRKDVVIRFQFATKATFKKSNPIWQIGVHVNLWNVLLIDAVGVAWQLLELLVHKLQCCCMWTTTYSQVGHYALACTAIPSDFQDVPWSKHGNMVLGPYSHRWCHVLGDP